MISRKESNFSRRNKRSYDVNFLIRRFRIKDIHQCIEESDECLTSSCSSISNYIFTLTISIKKFLLIVCKGFNVKKKISINWFFSLHLLSSHTNTNRLVIRSFSSSHIREFLLQNLVLVLPYAEHHSIQDFFE